MNQLIGITDKEIEEKNQELGSRRVELQNKLDSQKSEILETIDKSISHEREDYTSRYPEEMLSYLQSLTQNLKKEKAESLYKDFYEHIALEYPEVIVDDIHSESDAFSKLKGRIEDSFNNYKLSGDRRRKLEEQASTEVLNVIKQQFSENLVVAKERFNQLSKEFWVNATSDVRKELEKVISGDLDIQPEKRKAISEIIISYEEIDFNQFDLGKFNRDELSYIFRIGDYRLKSNKINISGLTNTYNKEFKAKFTEFSESIRSEHERKFNNWMQDLGSLIKSNIIEFSPELKELDQRIQKVIKEIYSLEEQQKQIKTYVNEIKQMISWK